MKKIFVLVAGIILSSASLSADEGMWLLQLAQEQHLADSLKAAGSQLSLSDIYSETAPSIKDAVGIFGRGCTGEVVSDQGLVFTNNHCGLNYVQSISTTDKNYVRDGYFAHSQKDELRVKGLIFTFVRRVVDVTADVAKEAKLQKKSEYEAMEAPFLSKLSKKLLASSDMKDVKGIQTRILAFYRGARYFMFYEQVYRDVRLVVNPPLNIGQFGGDQDNWVWPRQNCDFSVFRIYADKDGQPAVYSESNTPLKCGKYLKVSLDGVKENDFSMIMGFPGATKRFLTSSEIENISESINAPCILAGNIQLNKWKESMDADPSIRLKYLDKRFMRQNVVKNSEGMNKAIVAAKVIDRKKAEEAKFTAFAKTSKNKAYATVIPKLNALTASIRDSLYSTELYNNSVMSGIEFGNPFVLMDMYLDAYTKQDTAKISDYARRLGKRHAFFHNKNLDLNTDMQTAKALLPLYPKYTRIKSYPAFYDTIRVKYNGNIDKYLDDIYYHSICSNKQNLDAFLKNPSRQALDSDAGYNFAKSRSTYYSWFEPYYKNYIKQKNPLDRLYTQGLYEMYHHAVAPDANFTLRMTYGHVKSLQPRDALSYNYYTTLNGMFEKENAKDSDYVVNEQLRKLYEAKDYGRYAARDGEMHTCFITDNDITGGNSGSPVINGRGELIGLAFDGNIESLSGDLLYNAKVQRCINVDIRYVLFIIDKLGKSQYVIDELKL